VARALLVGCGCRGRELGRGLLADDWRVRGTTRGEERFAAIEEAGIEPALADPYRPGTVLDHVGDATLVFWLLGSARGEPEAIAALHGPRLERLLEKLVDSPVRGFVYEQAGEVERHRLESGASLVRAAQERWRIPVAIVAQDPDERRRWRESMLAATRRLVAS
jgi:uncharacterized protein YbjT (DUF2867 family)